MVVYFFWWFCCVGVYIFFYVWRVCWDLSSFIYSCMEGFFWEVFFVGFGWMEMWCVWGEVVVVCYFVDFLFLGLWGIFWCCVWVLLRVSKMELKERLVDCCIIWFVIKVVIGNFFNFLWLRNWDGCWYNFNLVSEINVFLSLILV